MVCNLFISNETISTALEVYKLLLLTINFDMRINNDSLIFYTLDMKKWQQLRHRNFLLSFLIFNDNSNCIPCIKSKKVNIKCSSVNKKKQLR